MKKYLAYIFIIVLALTFLGGCNNVEAAIVSSSPVVTATSSCSSGLSCGLVGYWTFDGKDTPWTSASAGTTLDKSGNNLTGTLTNMTQSQGTLAGRLGQALSFDGVDDRVMVSDSDLLTFSTGNTTDKPFTFSVWAKRKGTLNNASGGTLIAKTDVSAGSTPFEYGFYLTDINKFGMTMYDNSGGNQINKISDNTYNQDEGVWTNYAVTYTGSGTHAGITLYRNGVVVAATGGSQGSYVAMENTTRSLILGTWFWTDATYKAFFRGQMDDVRIYNRALSANEVKQLYNLGAATKQAASPVVTATSTCSTGLSCGLVGYWTFDGKDTPWTSASAGTTLDKSGNGRTGTLSNMNQSVNSVVGKIGQGLKFNASNSNYVDISSIASTVGSGSVTISAWVKLRTAHVSTSAKKIIFALNDAPSTNDMRLCFMGSGSGGNCLGGTNGAVCFDVFSGSADKNACSSQTSWLPNVWYHVVASIDTTGGGQKLYINSVQAGSDANTSRGSTKSIVSYLGAEYNGPTQLAVMDGVMDDVRIYNRALSANEVKQLYNLGAATKQAASPVVTATSTCSTGLSCGLVGYWTFDGKDTPWTSASAGTTLDKTGGGNAGIFTNMSQSTSTVLAKIGQGVVLDGSTQYVNLNSTANYNVTSSGNISLCTWFKTTDSSGPIIALRDASGAPIMGMYVGYNGLDTNAGHLLPLIRYDGSLGLKSISSTETINDNRWHFTCLVMDRANSLLSEYIDTRVYSTAITVSTGAITFGSYQAIGADLNWVTNAFGTTNQRYFKGIVDDVRIYKRALSATEIKQLYNLGR